MQFDPEARIDLRLPVERHVIAVLRDQHMRQQTLRRKTALDQRRRSRSLHHPAAFAPVAGIARANRLDHQEPRRHDVEPFAAVLADLRHLAATARAKRAVGLDHLHPALKPGREPGTRARRPPPADLGFLALFACLRRAAGFGDRRSKIVERQLPLVLAQLLRLLAEQRLAKLVIEMLEPADLLGDLRVLGLKPRRKGLRCLPRRLCRPACGGGERSNRTRPETQPHNSQRSSTPSEKPRSSSRPGGVTTTPSAPNKAIRPHSLGYRPPAPETIVPPSWPPGSATLRRLPSLGCAPLRPATRKVDRPLGNSAPRHRPTAWTWSCRRASPVASRRASIELAAMTALLDINVVSELIRKSSDPAVEAWAARGTPWKTCSSRRSAKRSCATVPPFCRPAGAGKRWSQISRECCGTLSRTGCCRSTARQRAPTRTSPPRGVPPVALWHRLIARSRRSPTHAT